MHAHVDEVRSHILEKGNEIDFLLIVTSEHSTGLLSYDGQNGLVVHLRIVQAVQQVDRSWP
jgi:hypothetical protein